MAAYHFLYDLALFGVITWERMFSTPLNILERSICCSFIPPGRGFRPVQPQQPPPGAHRPGGGGGGGAGGRRWRARPSASGGADAPGLVHGPLPLHGEAPAEAAGPALAASALVLFFLTDWWTGVTPVSVPWLYPLGFTAPGFVSADYFPLLPWHSSSSWARSWGDGAWATGSTVCSRRSSPPPSPGAGGTASSSTFCTSRVLYGVSYLIWG